MQSFQYLIPRPGRAAADCAASAADLERPPPVLFLRDDAENRFLRVDSPEAFAALALAGRSLSEVVLPARPRPPYVDVDAPLDRVPGRRPAAVRAFVAALAEKLVEVMHELFFDWYAANRRLPPSVDDVAIFDSSDDSKASFHLVLRDGTAVRDAAHARFVVAEAFARLDPAEFPPAAFHPLVDWGLYKNLFNLRLPGCVKLGTARVKRPSGLSAYAAADPRRGLVADPWAPPRELPPLVDAEPAAPARAARAAADPPAAVAAEALELARAAGLLAGFKERGQRGQLLLFDRLAPSACRVCDGFHHAESSLFLCVSPIAPAEPAPAEPPAAEPPAEPAGAPGSWRVVARCRRAPGASLFVGVVGARGRFEDLVADMAARDPRELAGAAEDALAARFAGRSLDYAERFLRDLDAGVDLRAVRTLLVRSDMGTGKTESFSRLLRAAFPPGDGRRIIFVSFRKSFSRDILARFGEFGFQHYKDVPGAQRLTAARVVVQVESLHRLFLPAPPDLVVLDESESVLQQPNSETGKPQMRAANFATFHALLQRARLVLAMDANLGDLTADALDRLRGGAGAFLHLNRFRRTADREVRLCQSPPQVLAAAVEAARAGRRIVFATNSLREAKTALEVLAPCVGPDRIRLYSSETPDREKEADFARVGEAWREVDVLVYTPTVSAGVSFDGEWFDELFGVFGDASCSVEACRQMLERVRTLRLGRYTLALSQNPRRARLPEDLERLRRLVQEERNALQAPVCAELVDLTAAPLAYDAGMRLVYEESPFFWLSLLNLRERVRSLNGFVRRFLAQLRAGGARLALLPAADAAEVLELRADARAAVQRREVESVLGAADITDQRFEELRQEDADGAAERAEIRRYKLRRLFRWSRPLTPEFVATYLDERVRRVYLNLRAIRNFEAGGDKPDARRALEALRAAELEQERALVAQGADQVWLAPRRIYGAHLHALRLLWAAGFDSPRDKRLVEQGALVASYRAAFPELRQNAAVAALALGFLGVETRAPPRAQSGDEAADAAAIVAHVNSVLGRMYGAAVRAHRSRNSLIRRFRVEETGLFGGEGQPALG